MRIAVCIPCYGDPKAKFMQSLCAMLNRFWQATIVDHEDKPVDKELEVFIVSGSMLTENRHRLVGEALKWGATHILWLDADHVFPDFTLLRLLSHNLPVVGCNYPRRHEPTAPTAAVDSQDDEDQKHLLYTTKEKAEEGAIEEVAHLGLGVCLVDTRVFGALEIFAESEGETSIFPLFQFEPTATKTGTRGEDVFFFRKIARAGIKAYVDHALSWEVGHITDQILTNAHACVQKSRWIEFRQKQADKFIKAAEALEAAA